MTTTRIDHTFQNQALSYDATPNHQPGIRLSFWFKKLPQISYEQFYHHWETVHADLTVASKAFHVYKIKRYVQFHQPPDMKNKARDLGLEQLDFDGCSEIWVESWDDWLGFSNCPDYAGALAPDCQHFMAMPIHLTVGYENLIYGEAIPEMNGGKSGLSKANIQIR